MNVRSYLISIATVFIILIVSLGIIAYGRGYRINLKKPTRLQPTGIVTATSDPVAAQVLVDGQIKTATNNSFTLPPGWYTVTIRKEGYQPWEKKLRVQGEVVTRADAYLFPTNPSLSPITTSGILSPAVSPGGTTIAYIVPDGPNPDGAKKPGLYTLELSDRPLGGRNRDSKLVIPRAFPRETRLAWSPDGTKILVAEGKVNTLYDLTKTPAQILPATETATWPQAAADREQAKLAAFKQPFIDALTASARILSFSPDETKVLYEATASAAIPRVLDPPLIGANPTEETRSITPGNLYVYDSSEDKNYLFLEKREMGNPVRRAVWMPTSKHLLLVEKDKIDAVEYDRTNWVTIYAGPFDDSFVAPWPSADRIVILTNLNPNASKQPNLYTVNLR